MCGICCVLSTSSQASTSLHSKLLSNLRKRGPDLSGAIENRVLCLQPVHKPRCSNSPVDQPLCDDGDVERQSCEEHLELNSLEHNEHDKAKGWTTTEEKEKENDFIEVRKDIATVWDGSDEGGSKAPVEPAYLEEESTHAIDGQRKLCSNCGCDSVYGSFFGQVLHLRGDPTPQPVEDEQGNILLWNGEVFDGIEVQGQNDTMVLSELLRDAKSADDVVKVMGAIRGPWSFIYWQKKNSRVWFGRDFFGRRSLLWLGDQSGPKTPTFALSSVSHKTEPKTEPCGIPVASEWKEVPACGIFCLDVTSLGSATSTGRSAEIVWYPWQQPTPKCALTPSSVKPGTNQDSSTSDPAPTPISRALTVSEKDSVKAPFGDVLKCVVGHCCLDNPIISPLNMLVPDQTAASGCDSETRDGEGNGARDGDAVLRVSREVQEKADELIRVLGEAVRKRVINVPLRTEALHNSPGHRVKDLHIHGTGPCSNNGFRPCLSDTEASPRMEEGDCEAAHRKEAERTKSTYKNHLDSAIHDDVNRVQRKPGHDPSTQLHVTNHIPRCHDNDPIVPSNPSLASSDRCQSSPADSGMTVSPGVGSHVHAGDVCESDGDIPTCITSSSCAICCLRETKSSRVGVLFSGGLDSIVLAALADRYVPQEEPIDLFNVAFEQRTVVRQTKGKDKKKEKVPELVKKSFDVPDRLTGRAGLEELQTINPSRKWNFVEIDVTLEELQALRSEHLCHLIYPQDTVLDDSIGCAIWFAARGRGKLITHNTLQEERLEEPYTSPAKVVLVGMGADEQLAGYARHRSKFKSEGWQGLLEEIKMEVDRISARNLGRDDRVISDHGRESRLPYLDEEVVSFLNSLPINLKADLNLPRGVGEKILLRVAAQRLGLGASSKLPKRAIQFGSRIAKLENSREKASDRCRRLEQQVD